MDIMDYLLEYEKYLQVSSFLWNILRWIGWGVIQLLKLLLEGLENITGNVFKLVNFLTYDGVKKFISDNIFLAYMIGTVCLVLFFLRYMSNKNTSIKSLFNNILLFVGVIILCVSLTSTLTNKVFGVAKAINQEDTTAAATILNENIYDITSIDSNDWNGAEKVRHVSYDSSKYSFFDITQTIDPGKYEFSSDKSKEILSKRVNLDSNGKYELVALDTGWFTVDKEYYYRYSWNFWTIFFNLLMTIIVTLFASFKYLHSLFNIGYNGVIMPFFAGTDFNEGSKIKKIISSTMNIMVNVLLFAVSLKVYRLFIGYISDASMDPISKLVFQLILTVFLVEGPWIIQELTGIDGGIKSAVGQTMALGGALFYGSKGAKTLTKKAKDLGGKVKHASKFMAGMADGVMDTDSLKEKMQLKDAKPSGNQVNPKVPTLSAEEKETFAKEINQDKKEGSLNDLLKKDADVAVPQSDDGLSSESPAHSEDPLVSDTSGLHEPLKDSNIHSESNTDEKQMAERVNRNSNEGITDAESQNHTKVDISQEKATNESKGDVPKQEIASRTESEPREDSPQEPQLNQEKTGEDTLTEDSKPAGVNPNDRTKEIPDNLKPIMGQRKVGDTDQNENNLKAPSSSSLSSMEHANKSVNKAISQGSVSKIEDKAKLTVDSKSTTENLSEGPTLTPGKSKGFVTGTLPSGMMQGKKQLETEPQSRNVLSNQYRTGSQLKPTIAGKELAGMNLQSEQVNKRLNATPQQINAARQTLDTAATAGSLVHTPSKSRQALAGHILGARPVQRPTLQAPTSVAQSSPVQTLKQDIKKYSEPLTDKTLQDIVSDNVVDHQIKKAEKQVPYDVTRQLGKNTGETLRKTVSSNSLRRFFQSSKKIKK